MKYIAMSVPGKLAVCREKTVFRAADGNRNMLHAEHGLQFRVCRSNRGVERHEGIHMVTQQPEVLHQSACDVGESAGLCVRQDLRTQDTQLQCRHNQEFSKGIDAIARKGAAVRRVWQAGNGWGLIRYYSW